MFICAKICINFFLEFFSYADSLLLLVFAWYLVLVIFVSCFFFWEIYIKYFCCVFLLEYCMVRICGGRQLRELTFDLSACLVFLLVDRLVCGRVLILNRHNNICNIFEFFFLQYFFLENFFLLFNLSKIKNSLYLLLLCFLLIFELNVFEFFENFCLLANTKKPQYCLLFSRTNFIHQNCCLCIKRHIIAYLLL